MRKAWGTVLLHLCEGFRKLKARAAVTALVTFVGLSFSLPLRAQKQGPLPPASPQDDYPASTPRPGPAPPTSPAPPSSPKASDTKQSSPGISKGPPAIPVEQIIQSFAEREAEFRAERDNFTYVQTFVVQTIDSA